jgi:glycosyltransferase involved in cell wall biosynthesis
VGSAGLVADTYDVPAIAQALERRLLNEPLWAQHRAQGLALAQELSWSKAALAMEAVYAELAHAA